MTWLKMIALACIVLSLYGNWVLTKAIWSSTAQIVKLKAKVVDYDEVVNERNDLQVTNKVLYETLSSIGAIEPGLENKLRPQIKPAKPSRRKKKVPDLPVANTPPRETVVPPTDHRDELQ